MNLTVNDITFGYDDGRNVLEHLSFSYDSPEVLCILGSNGQGKSTLLQCIIGDYKIKAGSITVDGKAIGDYSAKDFALKIAYIPQTHVPSFAYSVIDIVTMGRTSRMGYLANPCDEDREFAMEQLCYLGIDHLRDKPYTDISGGERQLVMIASALAQDPELLILDEPTAHLDFGNQYRFVELVDRLRQKGMGVLMTTHFPDHALQLNGSTAVLKDGRIQEVGAAQDVITETRMRDLYGIEVNVRHIGDRCICIPGHIGEACTCQSDDKEEQGL